MEKSKTKKPQKKGKGGRPKKNEKEFRGEFISARVTPEEKLLVTEQAQLAGLSESDYIRELALNHTVTLPRSKFDNQAIAEFNAIGVNLNQLLQSVNSQRMYKGDWRGIHDKLHEVLDRLLEGGS